MNRLHDFEVTIPQRILIKIISFDKIISIGAKSAKKQNSQQVKFGKFWPNEGSKVFLCHS